MMRFGHASQAIDRVGQPEVTKGLIVSRLSNMVDGRPEENTTDPNQILALHIGAFKRGDYWYAECLDLNLLTRRSTFRSAMTALKEEIELYLESAVESGEWDKRVPRPAPLGDWIAFYCAQYLSLFFRICERLLHRARIYTAYRIPFDRHGRLIGA